MTRTVLLALAAVGVTGCSDRPWPSAAFPGPGAPEFAATKGSGTIRDLGTLGGQRSEAQDISNAGRVVGWSEIPSGSRHAFLWTPGGGMTDLGTLGGLTSEADAINNFGEIVGSSTTASGDTHAFLWTAAGGMRDLGTLGGSASGATAINGNEEIVGWSYRTAGGEFAFFWSAGMMQDLGTATASQASDVNSLRQVVGWSTTAAGTDAMLWTQSSSGAWVGQSLGSLGGESEALATNETGTVVGLSRLVSGDVRAFVWTGASGMMQLPSLPNANRADAYDINKAKDIVGESRVKLTNYGVLWTRTATGWVIQQLASLSNSVGDSWADAINDNSPRQIVGFSTVPGVGHHAVLWTVP